MDYKELLNLAENNRQKCSVCGKQIPKEIERIKLDYINRYGGSCYKRVCSRCILLLSKVIDKKQIKKWNEILIEEQI